MSQLRVCLVGTVMVGAFKGRNLYYLRLKGTVIPLYVSALRTHCAATYIHYLLGVPR